MKTQIKIKRNLCKSMGLVYINQKMDNYLQKYNMSNKNIKIVKKKCKIIPMKLIGLILKNCKWCRV